MLEIAVIGGSEFVLGFQLAGIRNVVIVSSNAQEEFRKLLADQEIGIILTDDRTMEALSEHLRADIQKLAKPVVVTLSTRETAQDELRKMIQRSIGVDVW